LQRCHSGATCLKRVRRRHKRRATMFAHRYPHGLRDYATHHDSGSLWWQCAFVRWGGGHDLLEGTAACPPAQALCLLRGIYKARSRAGGPSSGHCWRAGHGTLQHAMPPAHRANSHRQTFGTAAILECVCVPAPLPSEGPAAVAAPWPTTASGTTSWIAMRRQHTASPPLLLGYRYNVLA
jgi:hypothetical protein